MLLMSLSGAPAARQTACDAMRARERASTGGLVADVVGRASAAEAPLTNEAVR